MSHSTPKTHPSRCCYIRTTRSFSKNNDHLPPSSFYLREPRRRNLLPCIAGPVFPHSKSGLVLDTSTTTTSNFPLSIVQSPLFSYNRRRAKTQNLSMGSVYVACHKYIYTGFNQCTSGNFPNLQNSSPRGTTFLAPKRVEGKLKNSTVRQRFSKCSTSRHPRYQTAEFRYTKGRVILDIFTQWL